MLREGPRRSALLSAMERLVKGKVVLDLGAGPGIVSIIACKLGAARVYAVDPNPSISLLDRLAQANNCSGRVRGYCADSRMVDLPEKVDLIIADIRGKLPIVSGSLDIVTDACKRFLAPGGEVLPGIDESFVVPIMDDDNHSMWRRLWCDEALDVDLGVLSDMDLGRIQISHAGTDSFLADPCLALRVDWNPLPAITQGTELQFEIIRDGRLDGFLQWFDIDFHGVRLSNHPDAPDLVYGRCIFLLSAPVQVQRGYVVRAMVTVHPLRNREVWVWRGRIFDARGTLISGFEESSIKIESLELNANQATRRCLVG